MKIFTDLRILSDRLRPGHLLGMAVLAALMLIVGLSESARWVSAGDDTGLADAVSLELNPRAFLPVYIDDNPEVNIFGLDMTAIVDGTKLSLVNQAGFTYIRKSGLFWKDIEPVKGGGYNWPAGLEAELLTAANNDFQVVLLIQLTPGWAQKYKNTPCGPMKAEYFDEFGAFLQAAVQRYSGAPYHVKYFEIWNEPDIAYNEIEPNSLYGCWGDKNDTYYGGRYYGDMLQVVYPMVKAVNPEAQVVTGGLLMFCDPRNPPSGQTCKPSKYFEGILVSGAKNSFDGVSFHSYDYYSLAENIYGNGLWPVSAVQPSMVSKLEYLNDLLAAYGATGKYLMNTEAALICDTCDTGNNSPYELMKRAYAAQVYITTHSYLQMKATMWYSLEGWRGSGLLTGTTPRPAYSAIAFAEDMLGTSTFVEETNLPNVTGFKFRTYNSKYIWAIWSTMGDLRVATLPFVPAAIWDSVGGSIPVNGPDVSISVDPIYIELP